MPYSKISELPDSVKVLPAAAQLVFMRAVNSALKNKDTEEVAFKKAWAAVKRTWDKNKDGKWVKKMSDSVRFLIPFSESVDGDGWRLFFPFREVYHMGGKVNFTRFDGEEMVQNFKLPVPDYPLPINERHDDGAGIYGRIADLRVGNTGVEWLPEFNDGAAKTLRDKGYMYASPEIVFNGYVGVYDGKEYNNVALGIAITPRPRLGVSTLVFSDGEWSEYAADGDATATTEDITTEESMSLNEDQIKEIAQNEVRKNFGEWVMSLFGRKQTETEAEETPKGEPVIPETPTDNHEDVVKEYSDRLQEKDAALATLRETLTQTEERMKLYEEERTAAVKAQRLMEFSELAKEISGLPEPANKFGETLLWLSDADVSEGKVHYAKILDTLKALGNRERMAGLFTEIGHEGHTAESVVEKIERMLKEKLAAGKPRSKALEELFAEHPELYAEYDSQNVRSLRNSTVEE